MEKKQTAVEWLVRKISTELIGEIPMHRWDEIRDVVQQALQMEKEQIINAHGVKIKPGITLGMDYWERTYGEDYYNETYGKETDCR